MINANHLYLQLLLGFLFFMFFLFFSQIQFVQVIAEPSDAHQLGIIPTRPPEDVHGLSHSGCCVEASCCRGSSYENNYKINKIYKKTGEGRERKK
jgi:hypothetical protein